MSVAITLRLPPETLERIDQICGEYIPRNRWIVSALNFALDHHVPAESQTPEKIQARSREPLTQPHPGGHGGIGGRPPIQKKR